MNSCSVCTLEPLIDYLISIYVTNTARPSNEKTMADIIQLKMALSRFMARSEPSYLFSDEDTQLNDVLHRCVAGQFSNTTGTTWIPGEPMHLTHLVQAILTKLSEGITHNEKSASWLSQCTFDVLFNSRR